MEDPDTGNIDPEKFKGKTTEEAQKAVSALMKKDPEITFEKACEKLGVNI